MTAEISSNKQKKKRTVNELRDQVIADLSHNYVKISVLKKISSLVWKNSMPVHVCNDCGDFIYNERDAIFMPLNFSPIEMPLCKNCCGSKDLSEGSEEGDKKKSKK